MSGEEPQFNISEERLSELRQRHEAEIEEAEREGATSLSQVSRAVEEGLKEEKTPLEPSDETMLLIEEGKGDLSGRALELLKISAYFEERFLEKLASVVRGERSQSFGKDDAEDADALLRKLSTKYEDLLEREREYPAARKMLDELRDYLSQLTASSSPVPVTTVWKYFQKRITQFNFLPVLRSAKSEEEKLHMLYLANGVKDSILERMLPRVLPRVDKLNDEKKPEG